jgi:type IV pilus assembly protein PilW
MVVASIVLSLALSAVLYNRKLYLEDQARINVNQNLRAAMDLVGTDIKQAGERISDSAFPVLGVTGSSQLVVRRRLDLPILPVCRAIVSGSNDSVFSAQSGVTPPQGCNPIPDTDFDGWPDNLGAWRNYRCSRDNVAGCQGNTQERVRAYIYDGNGNIELFTYTGENSTTFEIQKVTNTWARAYTTTSSLYILEERTFSLSGNVLQLVIDGNPTQRLVNQLSAFQVRVVKGDGTDIGTFPEVGTSWNQIKSISVTVTAQQANQGSARVRNLTASGQFFPRNVLSR